LPTIGNAISGPEGGAALRQRWKAADQLWQSDRMNPILRSAAFAAALLLGASSLHAGPYADDLAKCLVSSTTARDKTDLVRWIFANAALHPDVRSISAVTPEQRVEINRLNGQLLERLLTEACRKQLQDAVKYEGQRTIELSFQVLGQVAMRELMSDASVGRGFAETDKYMNAEKLKQVLVPAGQ
jgi:hypothetical protein